MKYFFLLVLLTTIWKTSVAQYRKIPFDTSHYWQQYHSQYYPTNPPTFLSCDYQLHVKKDTIISGKLYHWIVTKNSICNPQGYSFNPSAFLRQDTILKRIIIWVGQEYILYNFNKNVGDTALIFCAGSTETYSIQSKDSVLINDGLYHKRFNNSIIEGVGAQGGLLEPICVGLGSMDYMVCFTKASPSLTTIYHKDGLGYNCPTISAFNENSQNKSIISVFPNPTSDMLNIKSDNLIPNSIEIKNMLGQTILISNKINNDLTKIDVKDFSLGIYFITVSISNTNITMYFVKN